MKRSRLVFLAVAVVLVVGVAAVFMNWPPGAPKNTEGAIGAVEKFRTEQINRSGVVLMDEKTRAEENAVYGDLVTQSLAIAQVRHELGKVADLAAAQSLDAKQVAAARHSIDSAMQLAAKADKELGVQALAVISALESNQALVGFKAEMAAVKADIASKTDMAAKADIASKADMAAKADIASKADMAAKADIASKADLSARQYTDAQLGRAAVLFAKCEAALMARQAENAQIRQYQFAADKIAAADKSVESAASLDARQFAQAKADLNAAKEAINAARTDIALQSVQTLNARLMSRQSIVAAVSALNGADRDFAAKNSLVGSVASLNKAADLLARDMDALQNLAVLNMQQRLNVRLAAAQTLDAMDRSIVGAVAHLESRQVEAASKADIEASLSAVQKDVAGIKADLAARYFTGSESELAAINSIMADRQTIGVRASESALGAKADVASLGVRQDASFASMASLAERVAIADKQTIASRQDASTLEKRATLEAMNTLSARLSEYVAGNKFALENKVFIGAADRDAMAQKADALVQQMSTLDSKVSKF